MSRFLYHIVLGCTLSWVMLFSACQKDPKIPIEIKVDTIAALLQPPPRFDEIPFPEDNPFSMDKWRLGKAFFYDKRLSLDLTKSCGSCHKASLGFADDEPVSPGVEERLGTRNSPTLGNVAYLPYYMREGGVPTLELQILVPIQEHAEFDMNILDVVERLKQDETYTQLSERACGRELDAYVLTRALSTFERTLISGNSYYDKAERGEGVLSPAAQRGKELFFSAETSCSSCHGGIFFTDHSFKNNGLYAAYEDPGRYRLTIDSVDLAMFRIPSLLNVALTAPYMHDGSMATIKQVIEHYNEGGANHLNQSSLVRPLNLTDQQINDLVAFLESLTDEEFISNPLFHEEE